MTTICRSTLLRRARRLGIAAAAGLLATSAQAQTQAAMNQSAGARWRAADAVMSRQWQRTYAFMKGVDARNGSRGGGFGYAQTLLDGQQTWLRFRDLQCSIEGGEYGGGSMQPMIVAECKTRLTVERTAQLKGLVWQR